MIVSTAASQGDSHVKIMLTVLVFNVLAFLSFYGLNSAVFVAIHRGMGVHKDVIEYDRGVAGVTAYRQVSSITPSRHPRHTH